MDIDSDHQMYLCAAFCPLDKLGGSIAKLYWGKSWRSVSTCWVKGLRDAAQSVGFWVYFGRVLEANHIVYKITRFVSWLSHDFEHLFFFAPDTVLFQHVWTLVAARQGLATGFWATDEDDLYHLIPEKSPSWFRASKYGPFTVSVLFHPNSDDPWSSMFSVPSFIFPEKNDIEWSSQLDGKTWCVSWSVFQHPPMVNHQELHSLRAEACFHPLFCSVCSSSKRCHRTESFFGARWDAISQGIMGHRLAIFWYLLWGYKWRSSTRIYIYIHCIL